MASIIHAIHKGFKYFELKDGALVEFGPGAQVVRVTLNYERALSLRGLCTLMLAAISAFAGLVVASLQTLGGLTFQAWIGSAEVLSAMLVLHVAVALPDHSPLAQEGAGGHVNIVDTGETAACPICTDTSEDPVTISCGHSYCKGRCFEGLCAMITNNKKKQEPIRCCVPNQDGTFCNTVITLVELQHSLSKETFTQVLEGSFTAFLTQHPQEYGNCPTPDCSFVFRRQKKVAGQSSQGVCCTSCKKETCTVCGQQHAETSCDMHEQNNAAEKAQLEQLLQQEGIKRCSSCNTMISKNGGCSHMECYGCSAHLCWVCLEAFESRRECEDHLVHAHKGIFPEGYGQEGGEDAGDGLNWDRDEDDESVIGLDWDNDEDDESVIGLNWDDDEGGGIDWDDDEDDQPDVGNNNVVLGTTPWTAANDPQPQSGNWDHQGAW